MRRRSLLLAGLAAPAFSRRALSAEKVRVAVLNVSVAFPFWVAQERGLFAAEGIEAEAVPLQTPPLIIQTLVSGDADMTSNLVTLEGANINARRANTVLYFCLNGQNAQHRMEQFLVRTGSGVQRIADLKGSRIVSAPGPANMAAARGVLAANGLQEGRDYTLTEQPMGVHVGALQAGTFDAAYTLEPVATIAIQQGAARVLEAGVIATYLLKKPGAQSFASGAAVSGRFLQERPEVVRRVARAWEQAIGLIGSDRSTREYLVTRLQTPADVAGTVPMTSFNMVKDLTSAQVADFQAFVDIAVRQGVVRDSIDVRSFIRAV